MEIRSLRTRFIRGAAGSAIIQALNRLLTLVFGIVLARTLGPDGYGIYAYAFAIMSLLMVAAEGGVPTLLMREIAASHVQKQWGLLKGITIRGSQYVMFTSTAIAVAGLVAVFALADRSGTQQLHTTVLMLLALPLVALGKVVAAGMRGLHYAVVGQMIDLLLRPSLVLLGVGVVFYLAPSIRGPETAMAVQLVAAAVVLATGVCVLGFIFPVNSKTSRAEYRSRHWLKSAIPFMLIGGAGVINSQTDIVMLGWFRADEEVGIYRVAVQGAVLVAFGLQAAGAVVAPHFAQLHAAGDAVRLQALVTMSARVILAAGLPIALAFVFFGGEIAATLFGAEFEESHTPLAVLAVGQLSLVLFGITGPLLSMAGFERLISRAMWISALANIALNAVLIPFYGTVGAAASTAFTVSAWHMFLFYLARKEMGVNASPFVALRSDRDIL